MFNESIIQSGVTLSASKKALVLMHGRGADAEDILGLANHLSVEGFSLLAPNARGNSWYPNSFLAPPSSNEPRLSESLGTLDDIVKTCLGQGLRSEDIFLLGFSQGACLTLEYAARNARRYGGIIAFTGGLIGDRIYSENYGGEFEGTPIFIGSSDPDPHVPVSRVKESSKILREMKASVEEKIYPRMGHTINEDELLHANRLLGATPFS